MSFEYDVVIPTNANLAQKNRSLVIALSSIHAGSHKPFKVYVVSNGDSDRTTRLFLEATCGMFPDTVLMTEEKRSRSRARNVGLSACSSEFVLFMDDDIIASPEAIECFAQASVAGGWSCGSRRRFIPHGWSHEAVYQAVEKRLYAALDDLASDEPSQVSGPKGKYDGQPHKTAFITCFGGARRIDVVRAGAFNEEFDGWGLEDVDLMRRLLRICDFRSLADATVWHLDHFVAPYAWKEHWDINWPIYLAGVETHGHLQVTALFSQQFVRASDPLILLLPKEPLTEAAPMPKWMSPKDQSTVSRYVAECATHPNTAAIVLSGSAIRHAEPRDLDISRIVFQGGQSFRSTSCDNVPCDEHIISFRSVKEIISRPQYMPETWLWWAHRYYSGVYVWQAVDCRTVLVKMIDDVISQYRLHFLTYHIGRALGHLLEQHHHDRGGGLRHVAAVACIAHDCLPNQMRFPYLDFPEGVLLMEDCSRVFDKPEQSHSSEELIRRLRKEILSALKRQTTDRSRPFVLYKESILAIEVIKKELGIDIQHDWDSLS